MLVKELTNKERDYLIGNFGNETIVNMSKELGLSEKEIALHARILKLKRRNFKKFTNEEVEIINKHYKYLTYSELSLVLKRNRSVIFNKIKELGLNKDENETLNYSKAIEGLEDHIFFMYNNLNYSKGKILETILKNIPDSLITFDMIETFLFFNETIYKTKWKLFGKKL